MMYQYKSGFPYKKTYHTPDYYQSLNFWSKYGVYIMVGGLLLCLVVMWFLRTYYSDIFVSNPFERWYKKATFASKREGYRPGGESRGESFAREVCKTIFDKTFDKIRPDFLKNNVTGNNLELDLFNPDLMLAIEVSGKQHYVYTPFFHKNKEAFRNQQYRDEIKRMLCKQNGIKLIEVPYTVKLEDMETFIRIEARKLGYNV